MDAGIKALAVLRRLRRSPVGVVGTVLVLLVLLAAVFAPSIATHPPNLQDHQHRLLPPRWFAGGHPDHILGTDNLGRDVFSRVIYGSRVSVMVGITAVTLAAAVGVTVGVAAGFLGGLWDSMLMRFVDAFIAIPSLLLTMLMIGVLGGGLWTIVLVLGLTRWVTYARVSRGQVLSLREREYVEAARALGQSELRVATKHVIPNIGSSLIVIATLNVAQVILAEAGLSFLGFGVPYTVPTWGRMLSEGRNYLAIAWWMATFPGVAITVTVLGITFLGDWLRDVFDPRLEE